MTYTRRRFREGMSGVGLTPEQEIRCINEAAYFQDARAVPTVDEVLEDFEDDGFYADFFGSNQVKAAHRIVELSKMGYNEFFDRYHRYLEDSTIVSDYYKFLEEEQESDVIEALHEAKRAIRHSKNRIAARNYILNNL
jgi:hypothetical protein